MLDHTSSAINFNFFVLFFWFIIYIVTSSLVVMDNSVLSLVEVEMILVVSFNQQFEGILFYQMSPSNSNNSSM